MHHKEIAITKNNNPQKFNTVILVRRTENIRSANESEFIANVIKESCKESGNTLYFEPGAPWQNDIVESFNIRLRDELLTSEILRHSRRRNYIAQDGVRITTIDDHSARWESKHPLNTRQSTKYLRRKGW